LSSEIEAELNEILSNRIMIMDGATGTMIQQHNLTEDDYRGGKDGKFIDFSAPKGERELFLKGNNELLSLTQPQIIKKIHEDYLDAGADIIETNTFGANSIAQDDYYMPHLIHEMNFESARLAKEAAKNLARQKNLGLSQAQLDQRLKQHRYHLTSMIQVHEMSILTN
jgi:5-methyltetrahydrofolate--homocysteine methyltransferase